MEKSVTCSRLFPLLLCALAVACERDPASNMKIVARPVTRADSAVDTAKAFVTPPFRSEFCKVEPGQPKGSSKFAFNGPCEFQNTADVRCRAAVDDFYTMLVGEGHDSATISVDRKSVV